MKTNIQETIDRLRELDRITAPAPWSVNHSDYLETVEDGGMVIEDARGEVIAEADVDLGYNAFFINDALPLMVELRNAIPELIAEIDRLTAENAKAWDDGYKHGQLSGIRTGRTGHVHPYKNPYKEEK